MPKSGEGPFLEPTRCSKLSCKASSQGTQPRLPIQDNSIGTMGTAPVASKRKKSAKRLLFLRSISAPQQPRAFDIFLLFRPLTARKGQDSTDFFTTYSFAFSPCCSSLRLTLEMRGARTQQRGRVEAHRERVKRSWSLPSKLVSQETDEPQMHKWGKHVVQVYHHMSQNIKLSPLYAMAVPRAACF